MNQLIQKWFSVKYYVAIYGGDGGRKVNFSKLLDYQYSICSIKSMTVLFMDHIKNCTVDVFRYVYHSHCVFLINWSSCLRFFVDYTSTK